MTKQEFVNNWVHMNPYEQQQLLQQIADDYCMDKGLAPIPVRLEDTGYADDSGPALGSYDRELHEITVWGGQNYHGQNCLDDVWEVIDTVYHEVLHYAVYVFDPDGSMGITHQDIFIEAESLTEQYKHNFSD